MNLTEWKSFYIESLGCISNKVDTTRVQKFFKSNGWSQADACEEASLIILMTCAFTKVSEDHNIDRLKELKSRKRREAQIVVGGCLPSINYTRLKEDFDGFVFSPRTLKKLNNLISSKIKIEDIPASSLEPDDGSMKAIRISTGCMGQCTYCAIPFANGRTKSRSIDDILGDIRESVKEGISKIKFVSEDLGAYGQDHGISIVDLLRVALTSNIDFELYLDNLNPNWIYRYKRELIALFHSHRIAKTFYIPIQSASDRILRLMKREYTLSQLKEILEDLCAAFPNVKISTDFIVGFPTETEDDFDATRVLLNNFPFHHLEFFTYEDRPRTKASKLQPKVPQEIKEARRQILFQDFLKELLSSNNVSSNEQLRDLLGTYESLPINFNLLLA